MSKKDEKKTISIEWLRETINQRLASPNRTREERMALAGVLEAALVEARRYRGFNSVHWLQEGGYDAWVAAGQPDFPEKKKFIHGTEDGSDNYRRFYY